MTAFFVIKFLILEGYNKKEAQQFKASDFFVSGCKEIVPNHYNELNDTIYVTVVDDTKLKISTTNTPFYCDVDTIRPEIQTQEQNISIELLYDDSWADCLCGRHLDIIIENLKLGQTYSVSIKKDERDFFQFEVTFGPETNLMFVCEQ